jgi:hypothetical protein
MKFVHAKDVFMCLFTSLDNPLGEVTSILLQMAWKKI